MPFLLPLCLSDSAVRSSTCLTLAAWKTYGPLGSCFLPSISSLDWVLLGWRPSPSYLAHFFPMSLGLLARDLAMPLHCSCYIITFLLFPYYLWAFGLMVLPVYFPHFYLFWVLLANILVVLAYFPHPYLFWALLANIPTVPAYFPYPYLFWALLANIATVPTPFIPRASSTHLLFFFYIFYSHKLLLNPLNFLDPIITSLPLITFWAYWLLSQPNEFTNSLDFLGPFTSSLSFIVSMGLLFHFLGFLGSFTSSLPLSILVGLLTIILAISTCWVCFTIFSSHFLHIVGLLLPIGPFVKSGHQHKVKKLLFT